MKDTHLYNSLRQTPVAVIGLSAIFADAINVEEFWTNIIQAKDSITEVPANRWRIEDYYDPDMTAPDKTYCKRGGFLPDVDFNPMEFGLPPNILEVTDASQLLGLVAARDALMDAGYGQKDPRFTAELKAKTGVLLGVGGGQKLITPLIARLQYPIWERALRASGIAEDDIPPIIDKMKKAYVGWNENSFPGLLGNVISGRITNRFDLGGINSVVDAACAASLSAIKMSLSELIEGRADMMLTGGVDTDNSPFMYMSFSKTPAFSKSGNIRPFDDQADGMLIGEGLGMLVLKRLADAERDGDRIYAVIKGVGTSSDGRYKSVYAPRSSGQALAMNRTYTEAGYAPATVGLLEAHGTGTGAGDPTEFKSMKTVFSADNPQKQHIALGSVKSQVGHTKAAAGAAGMIKAVLALHHKVLPPTINVTEPNAKFDIEDSPIYINTETRPWLRNGHPRRASVSAFGFGGINVHIALEEYQAEQSGAYRLHQPYKTVLLQAATPTALLATCRETLQQLQSITGKRHLATLAQQADDLEIPATAARIGFVVTSLAEAVAYLQIAIPQLEKAQEAWDHPKGIYYRPSAYPSDAKVVALFSGQGSQYTGMGKAITNAFLPIQQAFAQADQLRKEAGEAALSQVVFPIPTFSEAEQAAQQRALTDTRQAQPAIGALSMGMYKVLEAAGFAPDMFAGHSFGELTSLWAAGVFDDMTFLQLANARGAAMATQDPQRDTGAMLAVKASADQVRQAIAQLPGITIANHNAPQQVVLGGGKDQIAAAEANLRAQGFSVVSLPVSAAFHTEFVQHAQQPFAAVLDQQNLQAPQKPVYANVTAEAYPSDVDSIKHLLGGQLVRPVLFKDEIEHIYRDGGRIFVEFGPKGVLTNLVKSILQGKPHVAIALNPNPKQDSDLQFRQAVTQLQVLGLDLRHIDPFYRAATQPAPRTKLTVAMGGHNYVSPATQAAYQASLADDFQISGPTTIVEKTVEIEKIVEIPVEQVVEKPIYLTHSPESESEAMNKEALQILQSALEHFKSQQTKSLEVFERFLQEQHQQSQQLLQLLAQQINTEATPTPPVNGNGNGNSQRPLPNGTVKPQPIVEERLDTQMAPTSAAPTAQVSSPITATATSERPPVAPEVLVTNEPKPVAATESSANRQQLADILLQVISEKTGYPTEMLELSMDMEADLGIDSIKRVEIFGAMTEQYPEVDGIDPQALAELRTLGQIVDYIAGNSDSAKVNMPANPTPAVAPETTATAPAAVAQPTSTQHNQQLADILLQVISEKTGYPTEMLELSMDMEADLGIDSIKRVEIFGAMTEQYPEVDGVDPQALAELRTLGQIVDYIAAQGKATAPEQATSQAAAVQTSSPAAPAQPATTDTPDQQKLADILLQVISEKTGYPTEMLELSMDMEADLGIDSIKRVEIFGAMTEQYPEVDGIDPQELAELRTLGQIVDYIAAQGKKKALVQ